MADELELPQDDPKPTPPSNNSGSTVDWEAQAKAWERKYNGAQGVINQQKTTIGRLQTEVQEVSTEFEGFKVTASEDKNLLARLQSEHSEVSTKASKAEAELSALRTVAVDFPDLVNYVSRGLIQTNGLQGDELKAHLTAWKDEFKKLNIQSRQEDPAGTVPPAPEADGKPDMTLFEIQDKKNEALRLHGPGSAEFAKYHRLEQEAMRTSLDGSNTGKAYSGN